MHLINFFFIFFLAKLTTIMHKLKAAQEVVANSSNIEDVLVECLKKIRNL